MPQPASNGTGRAWVVHPDLGASDGIGREPSARLGEACGLARAIDLEIVGAEVAPLRRPRPATMLGKGKVDELTARLEADGAELVVVDGALTPVQQRNLELAWKRKVIDRTGLILEIFGERARTREGTLQVELAALSYQRSRLVRSWTHLERQRGGFGFIGGPGESQLEIDRRRIDERIARIRGDLEQVRRTRGLHRDARARVPYPVVALVGYTNAGKSTLFNRLTGGAVVARDQLFATLDPTMRRLVLPSGATAILSDTVGFISDLPTQLVAAFRATLEEVTEADLVIHVRDIASPETEAQRTDVLRVLDEIGLGELEAEGRIVEAWNKIDLLGPEARAQVDAACARDPAAIALSAADGEGCVALLARIDAELASGSRTVEFELDHGRGDALAWLYRNARVLERRECDRGTRVRVAMAPADIERLEQRFAVRALDHPPGPDGAR